MTDIRIYPNDARAKVLIGELDVSDIVLRYDLDQTAGQAAELHVVFSTDTLSVQGRTQVKPVNPPLGLGYGGHEMVEAMGSETCLCRTDKDLVTGHMVQPEKRGAEPERQLQPGPTRVTLILDGFRLLEAICGTPQADRE